MLMKILLKPKKIREKGKKRTYARLTLTASNVRVKIKHFGGEELASSGYLLHNADDILITITGQEAKENFKLTYYNTKIKRKCC